ncbi:MAG: DNRLRE domain-containing protein [Planctomycetota bacterium]
MTSTSATFAVGDTYIDSSGPDTRFADITPMTLARSGGPMPIEQRILLEFDTEIGREKVIDATLRLYQAAQTDSDVEIRISRVTTDFDALDATWNAPWANPGGDIDLSDEASVTLTPAAAGQRTIVDLASLIQPQINNGDGMVRLMIRVIGSGSMLIHATEDPDEDRRPRLIVRSTPTGSTDIVSSNIGTPSQLNADVDAPSDIAAASRTPEGVDSSIKPATDPARVEVKTPERGDIV